MTALFTTLSQVLTSSEKVTLTIDKKEDGRMRVLVTPILKAAPDNLDDEQAQIRAALAYPIVATETAEVLDNEFIQTLADYAGKRSEICESLQVLASLSDASKSAKNSASKAAAKAGAVKKQDDSKSVQGNKAPVDAGKTPGNSVPPPESSAAGTDSTSLF